MLKIIHAAREKPPGVTRRDPGLVGDPWYGYPHCRICGEFFHGDEDMIQVKRFGFLNAYVHGHHTISELAKGETMQWRRDKEDMTIGQGDKVRDRITGFEGIVTGRCEYLTGCDQLLVQPQVKDEFQEPRWFDIDRMEVVERNVVPVESVNPPREVARAGSDKPAPTK